MSYDSSVHFSRVTSSTVADVLDHLDHASIFGFDTETKKDGSLKFIQIYSPIADKTFIFDAEDPSIQELVSRWENYSVVGHNLQFDFSVCLKIFGSHPFAYADTFLLSCSLQENEKSLKGLCCQYFGFPMVEWEEVFKGDENYENMDDKKWAYVANDPYYAYMLFSHYKDVGAYYFVKKAHDIDLSAMEYYMRATLRGLHIDHEKFRYYLDLYTQQVKDLQEELDLYAGWEVNTSSTRDIKKLLFDQMGLPLPPIHTDKGEVSVSKEALSYVPDRDGIISLVTQIKESKSIYTAMKNLYQSDQDTLHPEYKIVGFDGTSRVYSGSPSLSQVPKIIRNAIIPHEGKKYLYVDLKAAEFYILCKWAKCQILVDAYEAGVDLYTFIAKCIFGKEEITKSERDTMKVVVLSILYGSEGSAAARVLHLSEEESKSYFTKFLDMFPEIALFQLKAYTYTVSHGYAMSFYFRPRVLKEDLRSLDAARKRQSVNAAVQNTLADVVKICIGKMDVNSDIKFVTTVFDSVLFEVPLDYTKEQAKLFIDSFLSYSKPFKFSYEMGMGDSWGNAQIDMKDFSA